MKKLLLLPLLVVGLNSFAGWEMMFCDSVDEKGNCIGRAEAFNLTGAVVHLNVLLANAEGLRTNKIYFEIYLVDPATFNESLVGSGEVNTQNTAQGTSSSFDFSKKGNYLVKARDAYKDYITSREFVIR